MSEASQVDALKAATAAQAAAQMKVDVVGHDGDPRLNVCPDAGRHTSITAIAVPDRARGEFDLIAASFER